MPPEMSLPPLRLKLRSRLTEAKERIALRATLTAAHLLGLAMGKHLRDLRASKDPLLGLQSRLEQAQLDARLASEIVEILATRFSKIPERRRPHYTPFVRFRILELKNLLGWSREIAARTFLLSPNTLTNWERTADAEAHTVGSTVKPIPPITRYSDSVRSLLQLMVRLGVGGEDLVAATLARAGWRVAPRSVHRIAREAPLPPLPTPPQIPRKPSRPVIARFAHHVWTMDVTEVQAFLGGALYVAAVFDAFSRVPLAVQTFERRPGASAMARLLKTAVRAFPRPKYLITDLGGEFRGRIFRKATARLGIVQRFASSDNIYATARLERFWRTLKQIARLRLFRPLTVNDLEQRLELALLPYVCFRPHQGLENATPAEVLLSLEPAANRAGSPPRGRPGEGPPYAPFAVDFLDRQHRALPVLVAA
jgi:transposase InsO family protein